VDIVELKHQRPTSDTARIRGSYRYLHHRLKPSRAFAQRKSQYYRDLEALRSRDSPPGRSICSDLEASSSSVPRRLAFTEGSSSSASALSPQFDLGDYAKDDDIPTLATKLELAAPALMTGDFVPDAALGTMTKLLEEKSCRDAEKKAEWLREQAAQDACYIPLLTLLRQLLLTQVMGVLSVVHIRDMCTILIFLIASRQMKTVTNGSR
jgi:hypothetical protein